MTMWRFLGDSGSDPIDPALAGSTLRAIHEAAAAYSGPLRHPGPLIEIDRLAELIEPLRPHDAARIRRFRAAIAVPDAPVQAVHGDAHLGNVLRPGSGQVWIDWDESWRGPVAWDLASLDHRRRVFGELGDDIGAAVAAYGDVDDDAIGAWAPVVALWALAWGTIGAIERGEDINENARIRLDWLRQRFG